MRNGNRSAKRLRVETLEDRRVLAALAINSGGADVGEFVSDRFSTGGGTFSTGDTINVAGVADAAPAAVYQSERTGQNGGDFRYDIANLAAGAEYTVRLHFAEVFWTNANLRLFDVAINGSQVLDDYDVFVEAGGADQAVVETFTAIADASGVIALEFVTEVNNAKVSGIEIVCADPDGCELNADGPSVLFVRGADRSGGFLEAGNDSQRTEQLANLFNTSTNGGNHGWGELRETLVTAGFNVEQITETAENSSGASQGIHIDFEQLALTDYDAIVFGSNNAVYDTAAIDAIEGYVRGGGSTLFISDANFGGNWADASDSDQQFLDRFGLIAHQDQGTYSLFRSQGDYAVPDHPILNGVDRFDGEGVTPIRLGTPTAGIDLTLLVGAEGNTRLNQAPFGNQQQGPSRAANPATDGVLVVGTADAGKVVGHYDRNTFFNQNGAGTSINRFDNKQYALNLFGWLIGAFDPLPGDYDGNGAVEEADRVVWAGAYGTVGTSAADGNDDGVVDAIDYALWRDNLGRTAPAVDLTLPQSVTQTTAIGLATAVPSTDRPIRTSLPRSTSLLVDGRGDLLLLAPSSSTVVAPTDTPLESDANLVERDEAVASLTLDEGVTLWRGL